MARSIWSGFLSFGLVNVPVGLYPATADQTIHFNQLHKGTSHRIRYKKVDEVTGDEVATQDIVNGFPLGGGEYVVVTRDELKEAAPGKSETIEISDFVDLDEIDPVHFRQTYYLAPRAARARTAPTRCSGRPCTRPARWASPPWSCGTRNTWSRSVPGTTC